MSSPSVAVAGLGKRYRLGGGLVHDTLRDHVADLVGALFRGEKHRIANSAGSEFWALHDVAFAIRAGEVVGIIGRNGAGKSTLLKLLARITAPTVGEIRFRGRVGSLLEVGTGFHPELTGRENVYLNGAILGMTRSEIRRNFDAIVAFSGVEQFLETPVKRYSSGMYVRLAFAVAAHLETDILLVDEVLSVGDAEFQRKCLGKMGEVARGGRTVLFVSHNLSAVRALCRRCLVLQQGRLLADGPTEAALERYLGEGATGRSFTRQPAAAGTTTLAGGSCCLLDWKSGQAVRVDVVVESAVARLLSIDVRTSDNLGVPVAFASLGALDPNRRVHFEAGRNAVTLVMPIETLAVGTYNISLSLTDPGVETVDLAEHCLRFEVTRPPLPGCKHVLTQAWNVGCLELPLERLIASTGNS